MTATEPAAAVRFVNYLYESSEMMNLLTWGIEGRDWVLNENGQATYPEGVAAESVPYHTADFLYGDQNLITPWEGAQPNIRELQREAMANAPTSKYMSFALDTEGLENIITACSAVKDRYFPTLHSGNSAAWEKTLDQFLADLEAAGINELIAAYQAQLDAWIAANS